MNATPNDELTASEVLAKAADLISPPGAWTQGALARHKNGNEIGPNEAKAACWCAFGAVAAQTTAPDHPIEFVKRAVGLGLDEDLVEWNDAPTRTQSEVIAALRRASTLAAADGQ